MKMNDFFDYINAMRKKHGWYEYADHIDGKRIRVKGYKFWLQIYSVNGLDYSNCRGVSEEQYQKDLRRPFETQKEQVLGFFGSLGFIAEKGGQS